MSYGAEIRVAVAGLEKLKLLEDRVSQLQGRFTKLNAAIANLGKFAQPKVNIDTRMAERQIAGLRRQIQSLNPGTTTIKVRTVLENSGSGNRGNGAAAAAAAGVFGGFSSAGSMAAMRRISDTIGGSSGSGGSSGLARVSRDLNSWKDSLDDASGLTGRHRREIEALRGAYGKANRELRTYDAQIEANQQETAQLTTQIAALKSKISSTGGLNNTFADELRKDIEAASARLEQLQKELTSTNLFSPGLNFQRDRTAGIAGEYPGISDRVQERQKLELQQQKLEAARNRLPRGSGVLGNAIGAGTALLGTYAGVSGLQQLGQASIQRSTADLGLKANTDTDKLKEYGQATKAVQEQVKLLGLSQTEATQNFTKAYAALRPLGLQLETINQLQQGFVASSRASGRSVEEATASWRQYAQAIGKGRLNGDELVSISENAPALYQEIAKQLKVNVGALKDLGEEGKITADVLVKAGLALRDGSLTKLEKILQGPQQQLKNLSNEFENLGVALGKVFGPALGQELKNAVAGVKAFTGWIQTLTPAQGKLIVETVKLAAQLFLVSKAIQAIQGAGAVIGFLRTLAATQVAVGTTAGGATVLVNGLVLALSRLAAIGIVTVGVKYVIDQVGEIRAGGKRIGASEAAGSAKALQAQYSGLTQSEAAKKLKEAQANLANDRRLLSTSRLQQQADELQRLPGEVGRPTDNQKLIELEARIKTNEARIRYLQGNSFPATKPDPAAARQAEIDALLKGVPVPGTDPKDTKKAADDARKAAEALAADRAQLDKALATNAINLDNTVFQNRQNQLQQQYELERQLQQKTADNWSLGFTGAGRDQAGLINQLNSNLQGYGDQIQALQSQIAAAEQKLKNAKAGVGVAQIGAAGTATTAAATSRPIEYLTGDRRSSGYRADHGGGNYHDHLAYKTAQEARAAAELLNRNGIKTTELKGVNPVGRHASGSYHYSGQAFDVPGAQVPVGQEQQLSQKVRQILGVGAPGATGNSSPLAGADNVASAFGDVTTAEAELQGLNDQLKQLQAGLGGLKQADVTGFILQSTDAFRSQTAEIKNNTAQLQLRTRLELEGVKPEIIAGEIAKLDVSQRLQAQIEVLNEAQKLYNDTQGKAGLNAKAYAEALSAVTKEANASAAAITANAKAQQAAAELQQVRSDASGLGSGITSGIKESLTAAITSGEVQASFSNMLAGLGSRFLDMAFRPLEELLTNQLINLLNPQAAAAAANAAAVAANTGAVTAAATAISTTVVPTVTANTTAVAALTTAVVANTAAQSAGSATSALGGFGGAGGILGGLGSLFGGGGGLGAAASSVSFNPIAFTPGLSFLASGGPMDAGKPYIVGEEGPELILPKQSGYVFNARETEDALAESRRALSGRGVESETSAFNENKEMLATVTNNIATRVAEASQSNRAPVQVEYRGPQLNFNGDDYLPKDAAVAIIEEASQRGARLGHQRTMGQLKNNPGARRTIGI